MHVLEWQRIDPGAQACTNVIGVTAFNRCSARLRARRDGSSNQMYCIKLCGNSDTEFQHKAQAELILAYLCYISTD